MTSRQQFQFDFTPGLSEQFRSLKEITVVCAQTAGIKQSNIASRCDLSPSEFSKSLSGFDGRRFDLDWLEAVITETKDLRPIYYLMEKFLESPEAKQQRAAELLTQLLPILQEAAETLKQGQGKRR